MIISVIISGSAALPTIFRANTYIIAGIHTAEVLAHKLGCAAQKRGFACTVKYSKMYLPRFTAEGAPFGITYPKFRKQVRGLLLRMQAQGLSHRKRVRDLSCRKPNQQIHLPSYTLVPPYRFINPYD